MPSPTTYRAGLFASLEEDLEKGGVAGVMRFIESPDVDWLRGYISSATYKADEARVIRILERDAAGFDWVGNPPPAPPADDGEADTDDPPLAKGSTS